MPNPVTPKNPELRDPTKKGNDEKWNTRIDNFLKKRTEKKKAQQAADPQFRDEFGMKAVALMGMLKELGGLKGLAGKAPIGFNEKDYLTFSPVMTVVENDKDTDGVVLPDDIRQVIANCYWVAALMAVLEDHPNFLDQAVRPFDKAKKPELDQGLDWYEVDLFPEGFVGYRQEPVLVSNKFPPMRMSTPDGKVSPDELKALLYEKAFALWEGSYGDLAWGLSAKALAGMTGKRPSYSFLPGQSEEKVWETLNKKKGKKEAVVAIVMNHYDYLAQLHFLPEAARNKYKDLAKNRSSAGAGLTNKHCYSVVKTAEENIAFTVERDGQTVSEDRLTKVVYLRDPRRPQVPLQVTLEDFCQCAMMAVSVEVDTPKKAASPNAPASHTQPPAGHS